MDDIGEHAAAAEQIAGSLAGVLVSPAPPRAFLRKQKPDLERETRCDLEFSLGELICSFCAETPNSSEVYCSENLRRTLRWAVNEPFV